MIYAKEMDLFRFSCHLGGDKHVFLFTGVITELYRISTGKQPHAFIFIKTAVSREKFLLSLKLKPGTYMYILMLRYIYLCLIIDSKESKNLWEETAETRTETNCN